MEMYFRDGRPIRRGGADVRAAGSSAGAILGSDEGVWRYAGAAAGASDRGVFRWKGSARLNSAQPPRGTRTLSQARTQGIIQVLHSILGFFRRMRMNSSRRASARLLH